MGTYKAIRVGSWWALVAPGDAKLRRRGGQTRGWLSQGSCSRTSRRCVGSGFKSHEKRRTHEGKPSKVRLGEGVRPADYLKGHFRRFLVTSHHLHISARNFGGVFLVQKPVYSRSKSDVSRRNTSRGRWSEIWSKRGYARVTYGKRPHRNAQGRSGGHPPPMAGLWEHP